MNPQEFTERYCHTLHRDPDTHENYIKLTIADIGELGNMQEALLNGLAMLTQLDHDQRKEAEHSMYWLCRILLAGHPREELDGLAEWLKNNE
ncbi:hypothetical protein [Maribacter sp. 2-571]|uniref:hypothetical protein n=1 Tax=Maribacter sp. 2-571 TaxID=3417569 RepID=UPI003D3429F3